MPPAPYDLVTGNLFVVLRVEHQGVLESNQRTIVPIDFGNSTPNPLAESDVHPVGGKFLADMDETEIF